MGDELGVVMAQQVNTLAATFYQMNGRIFDPKIDFRGSTHPEERQCWNQAIVAHAFINGDAGLLEFQVS